MIEEQPNLNSGQPWSELALADLEYGLKRDHSIRTIADFICRTEKEVREKATELGYSVPAKTVGHRKRKPQ
jgi:hypothetical protein